MNNVIIIKRKYTEVGQTLIGIIFAFFVLFVIESAEVINSKTDLSSLSVTIAGVMLIICLVILITDESFSYKIRIKGEKNE